MNLVHTESDGFDEFHHGERWPTVPMSRNQIYCPQGKVSYFHLNNRRIRVSSALLQRRLEALPKINFIFSTGNRFELSDIPRCFIKPPFWWRGSLEFPSRPNGNPNDYKPIRRIMPINPEIPDLLGRLELDDPGYYIPGEVAHKFVN